MSSLNMPRSIRRSKWSPLPAAWLACCLVAAALPARAADAPPAEPPPQAEISAKSPLLLALLLKPLTAAAGDAVKSVAGGLFKRLLSRWQGSGDERAAAAAGTASGVAAAGLAGASLPSVLLAVDRLDPASFAVTEQLDVAKGTPTLRSGDVFALRFATNLPGQVHVANIDAAGVRTSLGTYNVLPGRDNRIPRSKGIQLAGSTGLETFRLYFYPCVPGEVRAEQSADTLRDLPACDESGGAALMLASRGGVRTRGAVNLDLADPGVVVSAAVDYRPREVVEQLFRIQHEPAMR